MSQKIKQILGGRRDHICSLRGEQNSRGLYYTSNRRPWKPFVVCTSLQYEPILTAIQTLVLLVGRGPP